MKASLCGECVFIIYLPALKDYKVHDPLFSTPSRFLSQIRAKKAAGGKFLVLVEEGRRRDFKGSTRSQSRAFNQAICWAE